jgi:hypothetical protein
MGDKVPVKVSAASMRQMFHPCTTHFIRDVCQARCCRSTTDPTGIAVTVTPLEAPRIRTLGATVGDDLRIEPVDRRCPFQDPDTHLCRIHDDGEPFGCIASPFTLNAKNTLIVRNRYRFLPCYKAPGSMWAYVAHGRALDAIFGERQAAWIVWRLDGGSGDLKTFVRAEVAEWLHAKNVGSRSP